MMDYKVASSFRFALSAAVVCCPFAAGDEPATITRYLKAVLDCVFDDTGIEVEIMAIPYHISSKVPVMITHSGQEPRLLWYRKGMAAMTLSDELLWLLSDHPLITGRIPA